ncbi:MAG TPA: hypothetical protein VIQ11_13935, partial [Mycobacterium sp.]
PSTPSAPEPEVKGLGIAPGARRPGAKKAATPAAPAKPAAAQPEPSPAPTGNGDSAPAPSDGGAAAPAKEEPPVKGLGLAKGARPPGKR